MLKKSNNVHLDGALEAFKILPGGDFAWASVVTLHPKPGVSDSARPSDRFEYIHHEVRVVSGKDSKQKLQSIAVGFESVSRNESIYACSVDGFLYSDENGSCVVCNADDFRQNDIVKTNSGNNRVNLQGEVLSTVYTDETARIELKTNEGVLSSFIVRRENQQAWDMVVDGKISKGDSLTLSGPLLSIRQTNGVNSMPCCMVSPRSIQKLNLARGQKRKGVSLG